MVALDHPLEGLAGVLGQVKAIGYLYSIWCAGTDGPMVIGRAITGDDFNAWVCLEPGCSGFGSPVGKEIDHVMALAIRKDRAEYLAFAKGEIVDSKQARRRARRRGGCMGASEQGVTTGRYGTARTLSCSSFTAKGQREVAERLIQSRCSLC